MSNNTSINGITEILNAISNLNSKKQAKTDNSIDKSFNIFNALGIEADEVKACRFIAALLDPQGYHKLGTIPLQKFCSIVLEAEFVADDYSSVMLEESTTEKRRVDIVIRNGQNIYPIEVKINAGDQDKQLFDYYQYIFSKKPSDKNKIHYLTPAGWEPSEKSKGNLQEDQVKCISFSSDIDKWLSELSDESTMPDDVRIIIQQYRGVIAKMCEKANTEKTILEAVELKDGVYPKDTTKINALIDVLAANGDKNGSLQVEIQKAYLSKYLIFNKDEFELRNPTKDDGNYARWIVYKKAGNESNGNNEEPIAKICVETNLYIAAIAATKDPKNRSCPYWHGDDNWGYLNPNTAKYGKSYQLNDCLKCKDKKEINITPFLGDIIG